MEIIFTTEPVKYSLTGIGRYSLELVRRLAVAREIERLKLFHDTSFIEQIPLVEDKSNTKANNHGRPSVSLHRQMPLIEAYCLLYPRRQVWVLRNYKDYIYHGLNFYLPHKLERTVITFRDIPILTCPEYHSRDRIRYMEEFLHESPDSAKPIPTVSDFSRSEIIRSFNYPAERIVTAKLVCSNDYIPRSPVECLPVLQKYQPAWQVYALHVDTMEPCRNIRDLLHAYQLLPTEIRMRYSLILSGYHGWEGDVLWQLVERDTREGWIRCFGYVPDENPPYLYATARAFVHPSFYERFGLPTLKTMSCGVPVICSNVTSLSEVVGDAGLTANSNDIDAVNAQILQSLQGDSWRETATVRGLAQAKQFSQGNCATQTINAYKLL